MSTIQDDLQSRCCGSLGCQHLQDKALERIRALTQALEPFAAILSGHETRNPPDGTEVVSIGVPVEHLCNAATTLSDQPAFSPDPIESAHREGMEAAARMADARARAAEGYDANAVDEFTALATAIREASKARAGGGG